MNNEKKATAPVQSNEALGFRVIGNNAIASEKIIAPRYSYWKSVFRVFFRKKSNYFLIGLFVLMILSAIFVPIICPFNADENVMNAELFNKSPAYMMKHFGFSFKWLFGSGKSGNSIMYNIFAGARISLALAIICAAINMTVGVILGAVWGFSKRLDMVLIPLYNMIANVPMLLIITVLVYILGAGFWSLVLAMCITGWFGIAFFIRTQVMIIRDREYSLASKCLGTPVGRIVTKNILPFLTSVIVTLLATELPGYINYEAYLSFFGLGFGEKVPSLGRMISDAQAAFLSYPWEFWPPVAFAAMLTIILYLVGQNLADATDPKTHM